MTTGSPASRSGADSRSASVAALLLLLTWALASCVSVSRQEEIEIGRDHARRLNDELPPVRDSAVRGPVSDLGHALARVSARPDPPYEVQVVNTNVVNAFAVPGV